MMQLVLIATSALLCSLRVTQHFLFGIKISEEPFRVSVLKLAVMG